MITDIYLLRPNEDPTDFFQDPKEVSGRWSNVFDALDYIEAKFSMEVENYWKRGKELWVEPVDFIE